MNGKIHRPERGELVEKCLRFLVGLGRVQARQFLGQREPRAQPTRVEGDGTAQAGDALIEAPPRGFHPRGQQHEVAVIGCQ